MSINEIVDNARTCNQDKHLDQRDHSYITREITKAANVLHSDNVDTNTAAVDCDANFTIDEEAVFEANDEDYDIADYEKLKGMVKDHYINKSLRKQCSGCGKKFTLTRRQRHCRRCGEVFCIQCVKNKLKLNRLARPDPNGKQRKVCKNCYHEDSMEVGCSRSHTAEFETERKMAKYTRIVNSRVNSLTTTFWPDQIDRQQECGRLLKGFKESVGRLGTSKTIHEVRVLMKTPAWQKSRYWEVEIQATNCRSCHEVKGVRKSSGNCRVCGLALCNKCSYKELMLYIHDGENKHDVRLAIINTRGCPESEPSVSLLLYICKSCKEYIIEQQSNDPLWYRAKTKTLAEELIRYNDTIQPLCEHINTLTKMIEDILDETEVDELSVKNRNMIQINMAKLKEHVNEFDYKFKTLKSLITQAESKSQRIFLRNYTQGKYNYLMENRWKCRVLTTKIENSRKTSKHDYD